MGPGKQVDPIQGMIRNASIEQVHRVTQVDAQVRQALVLRDGEHARHAGDVDLGRDDDRLGVDTGIRQCGGAVTGPDLQNQPTCAAHEGVAYQWEGRHAIPRHERRHALLGEVRAAVARGVAADGPGRQGPGALGHRRDDSGPVPPREAPAR